MNTTLVLSAKLCGIFRMTYIRFCETIQAGFCRGNGGLNLDALPPLLPLRRPKLIDIASALHVFLVFTRS